MRANTRALRVEFRKLVTTRTWWALGTAMVIYVVGLSALATWSFTLTPQGSSTSTLSLDDRTGLQTVYTLAITLGYAFPAVLGVLIVTTEYRYRTLTSSFLALPGRSAMLAAKFVIALATGLLLALVTVTAATASIAAVLAATGHSTGLDDPQVRSTIARSVAAFALWAGVGVGFGSVIRNQVGAVVAVIATSQLVEPLLRVGLSAWEATRDIAKFLPGAASDGFAGASIYTIGQQRALLPPAQGGLVLATYAVLLTWTGIAANARRDVT
jgi:ABC-2 type transport system permease protein